MKAKWRAGEMIRNVSSGHPYFVIHVYKGICTLIFDATQATAIVPLGILLKRDYGYFARDIEMEMIKRDMRDEAISWLRVPLPKIKEK